MGTRRNTDMTPASDEKSYMGRVSDAFTNIGKTNGTTMPRANDPRDRAVMELAIANTLKSLAEKRQEEAKAEVQRLFGEDIGRLNEGNPVEGLHSSKFCAMTAQLTRGRSMVDRGMMVQALLRFVKGMTVDKANIWIDAGTKTTAGSLRLNALINNVD